MRLSQDSHEVIDGVLKGLACLYQSPYVENLRRTILRNPDVDIEGAVNRNQTESKRWLIQTLASVRQDLGVVYVLGGWYGILSALMLEHPSFQIQEMHSIDIDDHCAEIAHQINRGHVETGRFRAWTEDVYKLSYQGNATRPAPNLIINTICEHLPDVGAWLANVPKGTLVVLQSNNYFSEPDHINCVETLEDFEKQVSLSEVLFRGENPQRKYTRFMLIGRR